MAEPKPNSLFVMEAVRIAEEMHRFQFDKAGEPYILHPMAVLLSLPASDWEGRAVAALHDVVEDTSMTLADLACMGFPDSVLQAVDAITKRPGETVRTYWERCCADPIARRVKLADTAHNSSEERLSGLSESEASYLRKKYEEAKVFFAERTEGTDS